VLSPHRGVLYSQPSDSLALRSFSPRSISDRVMLDAACVRDITVHPLHVQPEGIHGVH
jgi:hypothetical protein